MVDWREAQELPIGGGIQHRNIPTATNIGVYFVSDGINWRYLVRFFAYPNIKNTFSSMPFVSFEWRGKIFGNTEEEQQQQPRNEPRLKISTRLRFEAINFLFNLMNVFNLQSKLWQHCETAFRRARVLQSMKRLGGRRPTDVFIYGKLIFRKVIDDNCSADGAIRLIFEWAPPLIEVDGMSFWHFSTNRKHVLRQCSCHRLKRLQHFGLNKQTVFHPFDDFLDFVFIQIKRN